MFTPFIEMSDLAHKPIARDDVALNDFSQILEIFLIDSQSLTDGRAILLIHLGDVNVNDALPPELPSQSDVLIVAS